MSIKITLEAIEVHAEGEPSRVITSAADLVQGDTMAERFDYCRAELEGLRRLILHEPRGYPGQCAVFVLPPVNPGSAFGVVVIEQGGFTPMSGSNTMCAVTAMLESGRVPMVEPVTEVRIDTAVGTITTLASVSGGKVTSVTVVNVPAFVVGLDVPLEVPEFGTVAGGRHLRRPVLRPGEGRRPRSRPGPGPRARTDPGRRPDQAGRVGAALACGTRSTRRSTRSTW